MTPEEKREKHKLYMQEYRKTHPYKPLTGEALQKQRDLQREYQRHRRKTEEGKAAIKRAKKKHNDKMMSTEEGRAKLREQKGAYKPLKGSSLHHKRGKSRSYMQTRRRDPEFRAQEAVREAEWRKTESARAYWRAYKKKISGTPEGLILIAARKRLNLLVKQKGAYKAGKMRDLIGCTVPQVKAHLEAQFHEGMTWENYGRGGWHIDHIRPCASFDLTDPNQVRQCFHYTNLQPLWEWENCTKSDSWEPSDEEVIALAEKELDVESEQEGPDSGSDDMSNA